VLGGLFRRFAAWCRAVLSDVLLSEATAMSLIEMPAALARRTRKQADSGEAGAYQWIAPVLTVLFAAAAVVFASSLSVVTNLV
jgi:hypothetical protein